MQFVSDLHLHSKYSRAVSRDMVLPIMAEYARKKGIDLLSAPDWTHPLWFKEISAQLEEAGEGIYKLKAQISKIQKDVLFLLATEISSIYSQAGRVRRIHNLVLAPSLEIAAKINKALTNRGCNLMSDGRPIIGLSSKNLLELVLEIDDHSLLIPCHVWTPHFGVYGSASGFDSLEEVFGELSSNIYGIETGLSSDPEMNWQIKDLLNRSILSFSDAHSPAKMGREATVFELSEPSFENVRKAIMRKTTIEDRKLKVGIEDRGSKIEKRNVDLQHSNIKDPSSTINHLPSNRIIYTIEFYPEEGKYHYSGHRNCNIVQTPMESGKNGNICPVCGKRLTEGVFVRVSQLADLALQDATQVKANHYGLQWYTDKTEHHPPYVKLVPLLEILAESLSSTATSQKVKACFDQLVLEFGSEMEVLLKVTSDDIERIAGPKIAEGIDKVRRGNIVIHPGYDGVYGVVKIWQEDAIKSSGLDKFSQLSLKL